MMEVAGRKLFSRALTRALVTRTLYSPPAVRPATCVGPYLGLKCPVSRSERQYWQWKTGELAQRVGSGWERSGRAGEEEGGGRGGVVMALTAGLVLCATGNGGIYVFSYIVVAENGNPRIAIAACESFEVFVLLYARQGSRVCSGC